MPTWEVFLLFWLVTLWVFITGWLTPLIILSINRLLLIDMDPLIILLLCMLWWVLGDVLLWKFDGYIHGVLDKIRLHKHKQVLAKKKWVMRRVSHNLLTKIQMLDNKVLLFFGFLVASFSFVPDFFTVDFARSKKYKLSVFALAMFVGKSVAYGALIWWSIGFVDLFRLYF